MIKGLKNIAFIIPALDPDDKMVKYINSLLKEGVKNIILVDDGSKKENKKYFNKYKSNNNVIVLTHSVNQGKGRALKTAFNYILNNMPKITGVVMADSDGQHSIKDTLGMTNKLIETNSFILGTRNFDLENVPTRSRLGNKITTKVFNLFYKKNISDTQTGLRALPIKFVKECLDLEGERYEFEISMLIQASRNNFNIIEYPIDTIYFENNAKSHFNSFIDSYRIYKVIFKTFLTFVLSSLSSALVDILLYSFINKFLIKYLPSAMAILLSTALARSVSAYCNYNINKKKVFKYSADTTNLKKFCLLVVCQMLASWLLVSIIYHFTHFNNTFIKIVVDITLFFVNYHIQKDVIFKKTGK